MDPILLNEITGGLVLGGTPDKCKALKVIPGNNKATIYVTDAADTVVDGQTLVTVAGTKVVYSTDTAPTTPEEGTEVFTSTPGLYESTGYELTGLTNGTTYYFAAFTVSDHGMYNLVPVTATAEPTEEEVVTVTLAVSDGSSPFGDGYAAKVTVTDSTGGNELTAEIDGAIGTANITVPAGHTYTVAATLQSVSYALKNKQVVITYTDIDYINLSGDIYRATVDSTTYTAAEGGTREITETYEQGTLYGFRIDKDNTDPDARVEYLEGAVGKTAAYMDYDAGSFNYGDWEDAFFMKNNYPAMVKYDGTEDYKLDPDDLTLKLDGTASDVSDTSYEGNAMARMDRVWLKQYEENGYEYCYISDLQLDDDYHAYAHTREDGTLMDYIWLSCFEGALSSSKVRSIKGLTPMNTQTGTNELAYAQANGDLWYTRTWAQRNLVNMLLILISCSTDSQTAFGYGNYTGGSSASSLIATGTGSSKGRFYGTKSNGVVKVFHIENWWGNAWERIAGLLYVSGTIRTKMVAPYNTTGDGYTDTEITISGTSGGYISETAMSDQGHLPVTVSGSQTTNDCDSGWYNASQVDYAVVGGDCNDGFLCGALCVNLCSLVSYSYWDVGAALSCEQPAA